MSGTAQTLKRGALPTPRHLLANATPHVALAGAPPEYILIPQKISMWGNDVHGDCVTAEEAFAKACYQPEIFISDQEVIAWATQHGALEGATLYQVLDWMRAAGFSQDGQIYDDGMNYSVDWTQSGILTSAISQGPIKIGIAADQIQGVWSGRNGWFATGFHADANEDHCVSLCGYGTIAWLAQKLNVQVPAGVDGTKPGYAMFTWNTIGIIDVPSMLAITHEAWLRIPTTIINQASGWHPWFRVSGGAAALRSPITAVARNPNHLDLFVTGTDGRIYSTWWDANGGWANWFNVSGGAAAPGSRVEVVSRNPNHLDLFVTGTDGRIYSTWWDANGGWANWFNVSGGAAALGSPITAVARNPNHLDLFVTGTDGRIYSTWWDANGGWANWFNVSGGAAAPRSRINVVARNPNHLDLFVTGTDGRIYSTWWDANGGWANWFNVSGGAAALGAPIDAIARYPDHLDLFVTGTDGGIYSTWWD
jgi:hypothetical protein